MANILKGRVLIAGEAQGMILRLRAPVSFWGGVCPKTGTLIQVDHPDCGASIAGTILALPGLIGSSSSSAVLLELLYKDLAPSAILMAERDAILALGDMVAGEMGYPTIPIIEMPVDSFENGQRVTISMDGRIHRQNG